MIQPYKKGKDLSIIIWAAIWGGGKSNIVLMRRDESAPRQGYSAISYLSVLDDEIPRCYEPGMLFMQDNAPIHKTKNIDEWFKDHSVDVLDWPPYSPDLNPIEHLWAELKQWINKYHSELLHAGKTEGDYQRFFQAIEEGWEAIGQITVNNYLRSIDSRVEAVRLAKGWHTRF